MSGRGGQLRIGEGPGGTAGGYQFVTARNEAPVIAAVVADLVAQRYGPLEAPAFEVVVLDDDSDDGTGTLAAEAANTAAA